MHPDLERVAGELESAQAHAHRLADSVDEATWNRRPAADSWSMGECLAHLTLSNTSFFDGVDAALERARALGHSAPRRLRRDVIGWLLSRGLEPPVRARLKTTADYVPRDGEPRAQALARFDGSQAALLDRLRSGDGLDLTAVQVRSPFNARMRYSLYSVFCITTAHQRRHLWQMERARDALVAAG